MHPYLFVRSTHQLFVLVHQEYMINYLKLQSAVLKEALDDLEWPGSSIQIRMQPDPPTVVFKGEGHGDLQVCYKLVCIIHLASNCAYNSVSLSPFGRLSSPIMQTPTF
jgi:hypothetical protein